MKIKIISNQREVLAEAQGEKSLELTYEKPYQEGDVIVFETKTNQFVKIRIDQRITESILFLPEGTLEYKIPFGIALEAYHPETFKGDKHQILIKEVDEEIIGHRRNLSLNGLDKRGEVNYFPHTDANIVTRDEPWFESRNTVDGYKDTKGHGAFPYQSWGGGLRDDLEFSLLFGREVLVDEIILYLRADYHLDHDINWHSGVIEFSDGFKMPIEMKKTVEGQSFTFEPRKVTWIKLNHLRREISAAFSALTQIEVFGKEV